MNQDDIIRMAREAKWGISKGRWLIPTEELERFAAIVAAAEREECAKLFESPWPMWTDEQCAAAIRARGSNG